MPRRPPPMIAFRARSIMFVRDTPEFGVKDGPGGKNKDVLSEGFGIDVAPKSALKKSGTKSLRRTDSQKSMGALSNRSGTSDQASTISAQGSLDKDKKKNLRRSGSDLSFVSHASSDTVGTCASRHFKRTNTKKLDEPELTRKQRLLAKLYDARKTLDRFFTTVGPAVIIFEWDDLLCPTWFLKKFVIPKQDSGLNERRLSTYKEVFVEHALAVRRTLLEAHRVGHISIITCATEEWLQESTGKYMRELDFDGLASELNIDVFHVESSNKKDELVQIKKEAMSECLLQRYGSATCSWNVISISSTTLEQEALRKCLNTGPGRRFCKTVKVSSKQKVQKLTGTLDSLLPQLATWASSKRDIDTFHFVTDS